MDIQVNDNGVLKKVGELTDNFFYKEVNSSRHLLKATDSWGLDYTTLKDLVKKKAEIHYYDINKGVHYYTTAEEWWKKKHVFNLGHGVQAFLERKYWVETIW